MIQYRRGSDATGVHPDLAAALRALPVEHVVMDGEIVVLDGQGRPSFQRLQKRALLTAPRDLERAIRELPATLFFFDLLAFDDWDLRPLPLSERKRLLRLLLPDLGPLRYVDHFVGRGIPDQPYAYTDPGGHYTDDKRTYAESFAAALKLLANCC